MNDTQRLTLRMARYHLPLQARGTLSAEDWPGAHRTEASLFGRFLEALHSSPLGEAPPDHGYIIRIPPPAYFFRPGPLVYPTTEEGVREHGPPWGYIRTPEAVDFERVDWYAAEAAARPEIAGAHVLATVQRILGSESALGTFAMEAAIEVLEGERAQLGGDAAGSPEAWEGAPVMLRDEIASVARTAWEAAALPQSQQEALDAAAAAFQPGSVFAPDRRFAAFLEGLGPAGKRAAAAWLQGSEQRAEEARSAAQIGLPLPGASRWVDVPPEGRLWGGWFSDLVDPAPGRARLPWLRMLGWALWQGGLREEARTDAGKTSLALPLDLARSLARSQPWGGGYDQTGSLIGKRTGKPMDWAFPPDQLHPSDSDPGTLIVPDGLLDQVRGAYKFGSSAMLLFALWLADQSRLGKILRNNAEEVVFNGGWAALCGAIGTSQSGRGVKTLEDVAYALYWLDHRAGPIISRLIHQIDPEYPSAGPGQPKRLRFLVGEPLRPGYAAKLKRRGLSESAHLVAVAQRPQRLGVGNKALAAAQHFDLGLQLAMSEALRTSPIGVRLDRGLEINFERAQTEAGISPQSARKALDTWISDGRYVQPESGRLMYGGGEDTREALEFLQQRQRALDARKKQRGGKARKAARKNRR